MIKIASTVYTQEDIALQDGTEVTLKPLPIARLRRFMKEWNRLSETAEDDDGLDVFIDCCGIALEKDFKGKFDAGTKGSGDSVLSDDYREYLEDTLDMDTIYKIIDVAAGIDLQNPKLMEALAVAAEMEDGQN